MPRSTLEVVAIAVSASERRRRLSHLSRCTIANNRSRDGNGTMLLINLATTKARISTEIERGCAFGEQVLQSRSAGDDGSAEE